jgi:peptidoglycan hydrolase CwlO-like protein
MDMTYSPVMNAAASPIFTEREMPKRHSPGDGGGSGMETRIATLESDVKHIQADVTEIKGDIRRLDHKIDRISERLGDEIKGLNASIASAKIWALLLYAAQSAALLGVMAHGFGWIG